MIGYVSTCSKIEFEEDNMPGLMPKNPGILLSFWRLPHMYYNAGLDSEHFKSHIAEVDTVRELLLTICAH